MRQKEMGFLRQIGDVSKSIRLRIFFLTLPQDIYCRSAFQPKANKNHCGSFRLSFLLHFLI
jgi:hypothetical protein